MIKKTTNAKDETTATKCNHTQKLGKEVPMDE